MNVIARIVLSILQWYQFAFFARAILSWFPRIDFLEPVYHILYSITEPLISKFRNLIPQRGMFDLSFLAAIIFLELVRNFLFMILR
jgi:YggT family protein